jgi:hypothetical protein
MSNLKAIFLITFKPNELMLDFLNNFTNYDVYIIIDDNSFNYGNLGLKYKNLKIIQMKKNLCINSGFMNVNTIGNIQTRGFGWDKALYYFSVNKQYEHVWFIEDDIFFNSEKTLLNIDSKYLDHDLLCNSSFDEAKLNEWVWNRIQINLPHPYYCGMMCACRMSTKMIECLKSYADKNKTLFFLEAMFPTIAKFDNLLCCRPDELITVTHRNVWNITDFTTNNVYHPVKKLEDHVKLRKMLDNIKCL